MTSRGGQLGKIPLLYLLLWILVSVLIFGIWTPEFDLQNVLRAPSLSTSGLWALGADTFGRPLVLLVPLAAGSSLLLGLFASVTTGVFSLVIASLILSLSGSKAQNLGLRSVDFFLAFPSLLFSMACAAILGPGWSTLLISLWLGHLPNSIRLLLLRGQEVQRDEYWMASSALGATPYLRARNHLLPSLLELVILKFPAVFASSLISEATLSFLGMGAPVGRVTWGSLLAQGKDYLVEAPHIAAATGVPLILCVWALMRLRPIESQTKRR